MKSEISNRHSIRTYQKMDLSNEDQLKVAEIIKDIKTLYGTNVKIMLHKNYSENLRISTYGLIKNPPYCLTVVHEDSNAGYIDAGYALELIVLKLTKLGLGTCILGGTFKAKDFSEMKLKANECLSIVVTLGYAVEKKGLRDKMITRLAKAHTRKPSDQLFFKGSMNQKLDHVSHQLEQVRIAPSAVNAQPWRVIVRDECYDFYIDTSKKELKAKDLRLIDLGIAIANFTYEESFEISPLTNQEKGLYPIGTIKLI